ncbi:flagellar basal body P-ring formation protein FlgA [Aeromonas australiensis]|nr:flagellar basal body P-ring formation protein FlgA [Aeromonas australiensis]
MPTLRGRANRGPAPHQPALDDCRGEVRLPAWKSAGALFLLLGSLQADGAQTLADDLTRLLQQDASTTLEAYVNQQGWPTPIADYQVWLSPAVRHLPPCKLQVQLQAGGQYRQPWGRRPYLISCLDPGWQLQGRVVVKVSMPVWVTAQDIQRDAPLTATDLLVQELDVSRLQRGFIPANQSLVGYKSSRHLRAGHLLGELDLQKPMAIEQGQGVLIRASDGAFSATTRGEALEGGAIGDPIKVRNNASGKVIQAWIIGRGEVETRFCFSPRFDSSSGRLGSLVQRQDYKEARL